MLLLQLKKRLQFLTLGLGGVGLVSAYVSYSPEIAARYGLFRFLFIYLFIKVLSSQILVARFIFYFSIPAIKFVNCMGNVLRLSSFYMLSVSFFFLPFLYPKSFHFSPTTILYVQNL